jgi:signal transduction histidine kinase
LLIVVLVAIGCVLWFMREAMRNERMAVREKLAEAYRGHLSLVQAQAAEQWNHRLGRLDSSEPDAARFARCVREGLADSVICFDEPGRAAYPRLALATERSVAANAELLTLERLTDKTNPRFKQIAGQLRDRLNDYAADTLSSAQRRFLMHELKRLDPTVEFPTLAAEELAARYLEANPVVPTETTLRATELRDVWAVASPSHRVLALFTTAGLRAKLDDLIRDPSLPKGVRVAVIAPGEDATTESTLVTASLGPELSGWRLSLSLDNRTLFDTEADRRVARYLAIGSVVIAAMAVLAIFIARGFGRQVALARLKNDLVANVSHELKTPLTAMRAIVDTLLDAERFDEKTTREYLELLATENARLSRLIDNFLTFSRLERNKFKFEFARVRPQQVVEGAVAAMGDRIRNQNAVNRAHEPTPSPSGGGETGSGVPLLGGVRGGSSGVTVEMANDLPSIRGDADALVTALLNLLDNAWKYSGDEKRIVLRTEARNGNVCFAVEDNGIGLSPSECRRVFDRFYQTDRRLARAAGGCGLGLSIVQSIVEAHHGSVRVKSEPGRGSTFTIEIPAVAEGAS